MLRRLIPDTLAGRTLLILLLGLSLFHLCSIWIYRLGVADLVGTSREEQLADRLASVKGVIAGLPAEEREETAHALSTATMEIHWSPRSLVNPSDSESEKIARIRQRLRERVPELSDDQIRLAFAEEGRPAVNADPDVFDHLLLASVQLPDLSWLNFSVSTLRFASAHDYGLLASLTAMALGILIVAMVLIRSVTAPLRSLAAAADRIGIDGVMAEVPPRGPREVRLAAAAFHRMQARIKRLLDDRTQTLAAVSHDLRTPITRLRLRAHFVENDELRRSVESDLDEMEAMIIATLDFLRGDGAGEEVKKVDVATILETVCDQLVDTGHQVALAVDGPAPVRCRPLAIKRALSNLIENAVKYGVRARVALIREPQALTVTIDDDGPGIPPSEIERVFDPFYRLESSRSRETGGVGLGLTVARSTIRAHGGDITLANSSSGGLTVTVTLPSATARSHLGNPP